ncbi:MAG TPA: amino acid adenylation domain-containing protein [Candidatus Tectomicrobia bacterium]|nr:amino acid adenylation domain-containing protein [Candidatus Tectomicrobia bacterium]
MPPDPATEASSLQHRVAQLSPEKRRLIERMLQAKKQSAVPQPDVIPRLGLTRAPLSYAQQRLWTLDQLMPGSPFYNEAFSIRLQFAVDVPALERTWNEIVRRHESLRTTFAWEGDAPVQVIAPRMDVRLQVEDLRHLPARDRDTAAVSRAKQEAQIPFDLSHGPSFRVLVLRLDAEDYIMLLVLHHVVVDGWSFGLLSSELASIYEAFSAGLPSPLPELPIQYADYAVWQRRWLEEEVLPRQLDYWKKQLAHLPIVELPTDFQRPPTPTFRGGLRTFQMQGPAYAALKELANRHSATMFMLTLASFAIFLHRYTGQDDIVIGVPMANRHRRELAQLIGFFVNTLVFRIDCSGDPSFIELLQRVRTGTLEALSNQDVPFENLVEELHPARDPSRNPLFQIAFQCTKEDTHTGKLSMRSVDVVDIGTAKFDLRVDFVEGSNSLDGYLEYSADLFRPETVTRMADHLHTLLDGVATAPDARISELPLLTADERRRILVDWNRTGIPYANDVCVHHLVERWAEVTPGALAVRTGSLQLTYGVLNDRAERLAKLLLAKGVGVQERVAVCTERSPEMIVAMLAVWKAGGAFVPLDPAYPTRRLQQLLEDAAPRLVLTKERFLDQLAYIGECWCLDRDWPHLEDIPAVDCRRPMQPASSLAYVIYTSGSTGTPRGVPIEHRSLLNLISWHCRTYEVTPQDRATQVASPAFDASVWEIWPYLSAGASLHVPSDDIVASPEDLVRWLAIERITLCFLPTPLAEAVMHLDWPEKSYLRALLTGGDRLHRAPPSGLPFRLFNHYGPTESTVVTTYAEIGPEEDAGAPPIGQPIDNMRCYVVDRYGNLVPCGVPGELCIAGAGLARGYLHQPGASASKFVRNHIDTTAGTVLYKTGDLVRYRPDGNLEFLGRIDDQVKLRGFRIEPGEIEGLLSRHPAVKECVVIAHEAPLGEKQLVAYVTPRQGDSADTLCLDGTSHLAEWQRMYDETYRHAAPLDDPSSNIVGWNSSYTGQPIPADEMREQIEHTVHRLRRLKPSRVLEIGCGTGLLLLRLAPSCTRYVGTDFSKAALEYVVQHCQNLPHVELRERHADDLSGFEPASFDLVVLNSVIQYFPSVDYLLRVLESVLPVVAPGGHIFVGDVRCLSLLEHFHTSVELHRAAPALTLTQLRERVQRRMRQERELVVAPEFFTSFAHHLGGIRNVSLLLKRGRAHNELTRFRYDVLLEVGNPIGDARAHRTVAWSSLGSIEATLGVLHQDQTTALLLTTVPNARLQAEALALELMHGPACPGTVHELRSVLRNATSGMDPEDFSRIEPTIPYEVRVLWPADGGAECFDVWFLPAGGGTLANQSSPTTVLKPRWQSFATAPAQRNLAERLEPALRHYLREQLPEHMVPGAFVVLDELPLTPNGKLDRKVLPAPDRIRAGVEGVFVAPRNALERSIAAIWQEVLGLDRVGVHDNFFDLGGHSLLMIRVHTKLRARLSMEHSMTDLFRFPTVSALAKSLEGRSSTNGEQDDISSFAPQYQRAARINHALGRDRTFPRSEQGENLHDV